jgi:hypothetical protein
MLQFALTDELGLADELLVALWGTLMAATDVSAEAASARTQRDVSRGTPPKGPCTRQESF